MADSNGSTATEPGIVPVIPTFGEEPVPFEKWFGQPSEGGAAAATTRPQDLNYDPMKEPDKFTEVGSSGLVQYGGFVRDEFLQQLQGDRAAKTYREMFDNDAVIGALVFAIQMLIRKVEWRVEPPQAATVEAIVEERLAEEAKRKAEEQAKLMAAQAPPVPGAGVPGAPGGSPAAQPQVPQPPAPPVPPNKFASPLPTRTTPFHRPLRGREPMAARGFAKAGAAGASSLVPGISAFPPDMVDPETGEPLLEDPTETDEEHRKGLELAVFVETALHDMMSSWEDMLSEIVMMIVFGFSFFELVYKKRSGPNPDDPYANSKFDDGKIGWAKWGGRAQETVHRWEFDENGNVVGMWQLAPPKFQLRYLPLQKALLFRTTTVKGNPEGRSFLRSAWRSWVFLRRIQEYEAIGVERDLAGLPVVYVPYQMMTPGATPEEKATLYEIKKMIRNLRRNEQEGVVMPMAYDMAAGNKELYKLELLSSPSRRQFDTDKIIRRYEQRMAMTVLADFILLGHDNVGARSLGETKTELFTSAIEAILASIADVINNSAIPKLMVLNGEDPAMSPTLTFGKLGAVSLSEVASLVQAMSGAGFDLSTDKELDDSLRQRAGLPTDDSSAAL